MRCGAVRCGAFPSNAGLTPSSRHMTRSCAAGLVCHFIGRNRLRHRDLTCSPSSRHPSSDGLDGRSPYDTLQFPLSCILMHKVVLDVWFVCYSLAWAPSVLCFTGFHTTEQRAGSRAQKINSPMNGGQGAVSRFLVMARPISA